MVGGRNGDITLHLTSVEVRGGAGRVTFLKSSKKNDLEKHKTHDKCKSYNHSLPLNCDKTVMNQIFMFSRKLFTEIVNQISFQ